MRIVFMGASELGWECCRTLFEIGQNIIGIFSIPSEFRISWSANIVSNVRYKSFDDLAQAHSIPLVYVTRKMSDPEYRAVLHQLHPDILIVIGWYYMVPRSMRELARLGAVGIHTSLLPKYRGGAPLVWAIINGEQQAGASLFHLTDGVDDGDIVGQASFKIAMEDDIAAVIRKATAVSVDLVCQYIPMLAEGIAPRLPQDHFRATVVPQRKPEDGLIDWHRSAPQIYNWIRAQTHPYPGAFTYSGDKKIIIWKSDWSTSSQEYHLAPGSIVTGTSGVTGAIGVVCGDGRLLNIHEVSTVGGAVINGADFASMLSVQTGAVLGEGSING